MHFGKMHTFCMMSFLIFGMLLKFYFCRTKCVSDYTSVQLTAGYKTPLNVEISCAITVQRGVNYRNLMNIFVNRNHVEN